MNKQALSNKNKIFIIIAKIFFCGMLYLYTLFELSIVSNISLETYNLYHLIMLACIFSFALTIFHKIRKIAYICFIINLCTYCYMRDYNDEIIEQHNLVNCLEVGKVYDPNQKICRTDCWKWDDKLGCLKGNLPYPSH